MNADGTEAGVEPAGLRWALRAWPEGWCAAYGGEIAETWRDGGGRRRDLPRLALQGGWRRLAGSRPAASVLRTAGGPTLPPEWTRPTLVAASVVLTVLALAAVALLPEAPSWSDGTGADVARQLLPVIQLGAGVAGWRLTQRARDVIRRSWASGLMVGAALTVLALPLFIVAGFAVGMV